MLSALSAAEVAVRVASPWALKAIVDHVFGSAPPPAWLRNSAAAAAAYINGDPRIALLVTIVTLGLLAHLAHQLIMLLHSRVSVGVSQRLTRDMREQLFGHLQRLALAHHTKTPAGDAVYRITSDPAWLEQLALRVAMPAVFTAITLAVMFALLLRISAALACVSLAVVPALYLLIRMHSRRMNGEAARVKALESRVIERAQESFAAIRLVKTFGREPYEQQRFAGVSRDATGARVGLSRREARFSFVVGALMAAGTSLVLAVGGGLVLNGTISAGTLFLVLAYLGLVYGPLTALSQSTASYATPSPRHDACATCSRSRRSRSTHRACAPCRRWPGVVRFDNVSFEYDAGREVVHDVSFETRSGRAHRGCRAIGRRQDDVDEPDHALARTDARQNSARWHRHAEVFARLASRTRRVGAAGRDSRVGYGAGESSLRPADRDRRRHRGGRQERERARLHHATRRRLRYPSGNSWQPLVRRTAAAPEHRPRVSQRRSTADSRRANVGARHPVRGDSLSRCLGACGGTARRLSSPID